MSRTVYIEITGMGSITLEDEDERTDADIVAEEEANFREDPTFYWEHAEQHTIKVVVASEDGTTQPVIPGMENIRG